MTCRAFVDPDYKPPFTKEENYEELFKKYYECKLKEGKTKRARLAWREFNIYFKNEDRQKLSEFLYDEATGFYLHTPTEMYYDSNSAVYYDPKKKRCYQYNYTSSRYYRSHFAHR